MKVKIGNCIYASEDVPIMLIMSEQDKANIQNMSPDATRYAAAPCTMEEADMRKFMDVDSEAM